MGKIRLKRVLFFTPMLIILFSLVQCSPKLYTTGKDFVASGNYEDAIAQFTKLIEETPEYTEAYVARAEAYEKADKKEEAASDYKRATAFEDKDESIYYNAGRLYYELEQYEEAIPMLVKVTALDKKHINAYKYKMNSYIALEKYEQALKESNSLVDLNATAENFYWKGYIGDKLEDYNKAETDLRKAIEKSPNMLESYILLGNVLLKAKKFDQSLNICTRALGIDSKCKEALWTRSKIYKEKIDYPSAINDLSKMIIFSPDDLEAFFARGIYYQEFNQHQSAINDFSKVISIDSKNALAYFHRAKSNEEITQYEKAISDYQTYAKLSDDSDKEAKDRLKIVKDRLYELNREGNKPVLTFTEPAEKAGNSINIIEDAIEVTLLGLIADESDIKSAKVDGVDVTFDENGKNNEFSVTLNVTGKETVSIAIADVYNNVLASTYKLNRTEINPPQISLIAPYASSTGEIYMDVDNRKLYVEGRIADENKIKSIIVDEMTASYSVDAMNPEFYATIDIANKNKFVVKAEDIYGNVSEMEYRINREALEISQENPMGKTWVIFVENSDYETFASLEGPIKDVSMMKAALANYKVHNILHKQNMSKAEMERFFAIELRDLVRSNQVNSLLVWYAGHGKFINDIGYWVPTDATRDDEFTYFNISTLKAALQSYATFVTHTLVISDACESGPTFYQAMRSGLKDRDCGDWEATKFKSSQVFSSAGYELAVDNSQFTRTFANTLRNNPNACLPIENVVSKVTVAVAKGGMQKPQFGKIDGLEDEGGTFFFIAKER
ncbi:MAG: tetratricopeptide repeat protein [Bacteroidales bacterium]|nr:tetratricopeptide repeat protein [Bacteroidales bacterium]